MSEKFDPCNTCDGYDPKTDSFHDPERCFEYVTEDWPDGHKKRKVTTEG